MKILSWICAIIWPNLVVMFHLNLDTNLIVKFTNELVKTPHIILFACQSFQLMSWTRSLQNLDKTIAAINLATVQNQFKNSSLFSQILLNTYLTHRNHARTSIILDCGCSMSSNILSSASEGQYFNRTYQWLLWDSLNIGLEDLLDNSKVDYLGPNAQVTFVNASSSLISGSYRYRLFDIHSKGRHLHAPWELLLVAEYTANKPPIWIQYERDLFYWQGIAKREQFKGLTLRGATVIDQDNVTTNEEIEGILGRRSKDSGVAAFTKYHYELLRMLRARLNFTVNFRSTRGWAGRLGNTRYRLGYLGIIQRNEADIGASGAFNRINRFAEFDIIHQSWKFESAFLYRFTPDLDAHGKSGNFLAPFDDAVWLVAILTFLTLSAFWRLVEYMSKRWRLFKHQEHHHRKTHQNQTKNQQQQLVQQRQQDLKNDIHGTGGEQWWRNENDHCYSAFSNEKFIGVDDSETSLLGLSLKTFAAICQQGMEPIPNGIPSRAIIITTFLFSLLMYNYYTSSVVGGLLSSTVEGPSNVDDVVDSTLKLSFEEDVGYYKVLFRENKSPTVLRLISRKVAPPRGEADLPIYAHLQEAIPFLKRGHVAYHCEVVDAYPEIAKHFDANEICELRVVTGLLETEIMNWIVSKNSQYTELFRTVMCRAREVGLVERLLRQRQSKKPICQATYMIYPVGISGVLSAFFMLAAAALLSVFFLGIEIYKRKLSKSI